MSLHQSLELSRSAATLASSIYRHLGKEKLKFLPLTRVMIEVSDCLLIAYSQTNHEGISIHDDLISTDQAGDNSFCSNHRGQLSF
jgi:hypothetical protein